MQQKDSGFSGDHLYYGKMHDAVFLGIDPASTSGWAILLPPKMRLYASGVADNAKERMAVFEKAKDIAEDMELPLIVGAEKWTPGGWKSFNSMMGVGSSWGKWSEVLEIGGHKKKNIFRVEPNEWRRRLLGARPGRHKRDELKAMALRNVHGRGWPHVTDDNEAEAILIAIYFALKTDLLLLRKKATPTHAIPLGSGLQRRPHRFVFGS